MKQVHILVSGRVQMVGFRISTARKARELGLTGWVKNTDDSRVEAIFQGDNEAMEEMLFWCHQGPPSAQVDQVEIIDDQSMLQPTFDSFEVVR